VGVLLRVGGVPRVAVDSFFSLEVARQRPYLPYAPMFIGREYRRRQAAGTA
jgi:hypothetical protein